MTNYRRKRNPIKEIGKQYSVNEQITATEVRILDEAGEMVGLFKRSEALKLAEDKGMDLIEINPKAQPPVVRLMEYSKFKYQQDKSEKSKPKISAEIKVLRVSVRISDHDLLVQAKKADEFLDKGIKVKLQVMMKYRERQHPEVAEETMIKFLKLITIEHTFESEPKLVGDSNFCTIKSKK